MKIRRVLERHYALVVLLVAAFVSRLMLADWNSYWNDELLSIHTYGSNNPDVVSAIVNLAENSIHPPLYQFLLYGWITIFGDGEIATRTLSNVFITFGALGIYAIALRVGGRPVALGSAVVFSTMALPTYYGLESRSYALTITLSIASAFFAVKIVELFRHEELARRSELQIYAVAIAFTNSMLLLTHYYNIFLVAAQAMLLVFMLARSRARKAWLDRIGILTAASVIPALAFLAVWGRVFIRQYTDRSGSYQVGGSAARDPLDLLVSSLIQPNFGASTLVVGAVVVVSLIPALLALVSLFTGRANSNSASSSPWDVAYLSAWLLLPLLATYAAFEVLGVERYEDRYFVYSIPPLAILLVLGLRAILSWLVRASAGRRDHVLVTVASVGVILLGVVPLGVDAATTRKTDYRGTVWQVANLVANDPENKYFIVDASWARPGSDYYFARFSSRVSPSSDYTPADDRAMNHVALLDEAALQDSSRLVVMLTHLPSTRYSNLLEYLNDQLDLRHVESDGTGRGYYIFDVPLDATERAG